MVQSWLVNLLGSSPFSAAVSRREISLLPGHLRLQGSGHRRGVVQRRRHHRQLRSRGRGLDDGNSAPDGRVWDASGQLRRTS